VTNEQAFKTMARHMLAQGKRSVAVGRDSFGVEHESCRYRGPDGLKCAVGAIIPDEEYRESLEGLPARQVQDLVPSLQGLDDSMISTVQRIHDNWPVCDWRKLLREECVFYCWAVDF
jgi:hypothetical protein